ncbi:MAG: NAD-binding protein, partial [Planctomycetota bacterium]|nr:NAD-binding protein [Planctomycetota bacterium]
LSDDVEIKRDIVIVDENLEQCPIDDPKVHFVKGDPAETETLLRAGILKANTAILMADKSAGNYNDVDSRNILVALAVETLNTKVHTCVEILNPRNYKHLARARADEVVCPSDIGTRLLAQSALTHGLSRFFNEIISFGEGSEIYKVKLASRLAGRPFADLLALLSKEHNIILLAVDQDGELLINPRHDLTVRQGASVYVLAEKFPREIEA